MTHLDIGTAAFGALIGERLSIIRRAAATLVLHFGAIRPHPTGAGDAGAYVLHVQCPWRLDGPDGVVTGSDDLLEYAGEWPWPTDWSFEDGNSIQDAAFDALLGPCEPTRGWVNTIDRLVVTGAHVSDRDVCLALTGGYFLYLFPASRGREAWRLFAPGRDSRHLVFPPEH